jgi:DHA1 family bicyclomycin/chloramphenicol resistance-like MFS transporter
MTSGTRYLDRATAPHISTLILLAGVSALTMNIFLPSLPTMAVYFNVEYSVMQLSVALYLACSGVLQIIVGPVSDRFGRRPVLIWALVLFLLSTLGCILAPNAAVFLVFRMAQAIIATGMALSRAVIRDMVPGAQAASMIGYVTMGMSIVPMVGPFFGGVLESFFGWQANFWVLFALGSGLLWLVWRDLGETLTDPSASMTAQFRAYPELLKSRRFWGYCLTAAFSAGAFFAYLGGAPFVGKEVFKMDPFWLGFAFGAPAAGYLTGNFLSGRYSVRIGINRMVLAGCSLSAAGLLVMLLVFLAGYGSPVLFFSFVVFIGLGNGITLPNANAGMLSVRPGLAGSAAGLGGAIMIGGGAALSALAGALLTPETGAFPLLWIMTLSALMAVVSILYVLHRERTAPATPDT